jgi:hypothetical protein
VADGQVTISVDQSGLLALLQQVFSALTGMQAVLTDINGKLATIMSEDAAVAAVTADLAAQMSALQAALSSIATSNAAILADLQAGGVTPATITALQNQQQALDSLASGATAQAATEAGKVPPA